MVEEELTEEQIAEFKKIDANVRKYFIDNFLNEYEEKRDVYLQVEVMRMH